MEAQSIDSTDHKHADKVINLLKNASYQLQLAEEMGYGKKDKEYYALYQSIKDLRKSVERKGDSKKKFKKLLDDMNKFNDRLFPLVP
jgi:molybdenum cofactor biosynthesis enzyme MoaA